ncbi:MAG: hypothetical protein LBJ00_14930 [Planctomycetaceae bacterium]|nr:hypothetical protein [Planctomycetaceae bacterium]
MKRLFKGEAYRPTGYGISTQKTQTIMIFSDQIFQNSFFLSANITTLCVLDILKLL